MTSTFAPDDLRDPLESFEELLPRSLPPALIEERQEVGDGVSHQTFLGEEIPEAPVGANATRRGSKNLLADRDRVAIQTDALVRRDRFVVGGDAVVGRPARTIRSPWKT